jgi:hypothetical protein
MRRQPFRRQVTFSLDQADWQRLYREAARQGLSVAEVCRRELSPLLGRLSDPSLSPRWGPLSDASDGVERGGVESGDERGSGGPKSPPRPLNRRDHPWRQQAFPQSEWASVPESLAPRESRTWEQSASESQLRDLGLPGCQPTGCQPLEQNPSEESLPE